MSRVEASRRLAEIRWTRRAFESSAEYIGIDEAIGLGSDGLGWGSQRLETLRERRITRAELNAHLKKVRWKYWHFISIIILVDKRDMMIRPCEMERSR